MVKKGIILGHIVSSKGMEVDKAKVGSIFKIPIPKMVKDIYSFLKHAGLYRRFIKNFSNIVKPLCHLLAQDMQFEWT